MYARPGSLTERIDETRPNAPFRRFLAVCGACGCWQELGIRRELLADAGVKLTPADAFRVRNWSIGPARVRCPFCMGAQHRPEGAPEPLPEPPEPEITEVRP